MSKFNDMEWKDKYMSLASQHCRSMDDAEEMVEELEQSLSASQSEVERLRGALEKLACLGNGEHYGNSHGNVIAIKALQENT